MTGNIFQEWRDGVEEIESKLDLLEQNRLAVQFDDLVGTHDAIVAHLRDQAWRARDDAASHQSDADILESRIDTVAREAEGLMIDGADPAHILVRVLASLRAPYTKPDWRLMPTALS